MRVKKKLWQVAFGGWSGRYVARWPAGAVAQFRREFGQRMAENKQAVRTERGSGGWDWLSVGIVTGLAQPA